MKQKFYIIAGILLLLAVVVIMTADLFSVKKADKNNPWDYGMKELKQSVSSPGVWIEILSFKPEMTEIHALSHGPDGRIYVAGSGSCEIFTADGKFSSKFTLTGMASCMTVDRSQKIYIGLQDHIEVFDVLGKRLAVWKAPDAESVLTSVAVSDSTVYLGDAGKKTVWQCDRNGKILGHIGDKDPERGIPGFVIPSPYFDLAFGRFGELWVANTGRHSLEQFTPDGSLKTSWGEASNSPEGFCGCCNPSHFTILGDGSFVTAEKGIERIKLYSPEGKFICAIAGPEAFTEGTRGLDLACDASGRVIVLDPERKLVRIFAKKQTSESRPGINRIFYQKLS